MDRYRSILDSWKALFICLIFICFFGSVKSQIVKPFNLIPDFGSIDSAGFAWHVFTDSNFIYVIGNTNRSYYQSTSPLLARFDYDGHFVNSYTIIDSSSNDYMLMDELPIIVEPDGFTMMLDRMDTLGSTYSKELIRFDKHNGGIIQKMRLPHPPNSIFNFVSGLYNKTSDGHYIILGYIGDAANLYLSKLDSSFNTISQIVLPDIHQWDFAGYLKEQVDGSLILVGYSTDSAYWWPFFLHVSPTGEILEFKLAPEGLRTRGSGPTNTVLRDEHDNWIFSSIMDTTSLGCHTCTREIPFVCAISPDFDSLLWVSYFSSPPYEDQDRNVTFFLTEANDHSGYVSSLNKTSGSSWVTYLSKVSSDGDSLWTRRISPLGWENIESTTMSILQLVATPYNTFVGVGTVSDDLGPNRPWIFQIDSLGCLVPGCDQSVSVKTIEGTISKDFKVYPNPVSKKLYILYRGKNSTHSIYNITLMSLDGRLIRTTTMHPEQSEQFILSLPQIPAGEYILNIENADGSYRQLEKIIKE